MFGAQRSVEFITWNLEGRGLAIQCSLVAFEEMVEAAQSGFERFPFGGEEVGGVLFGTREPDAVRIVASRPVPCQHAAGPGFLLSASDEDNLRHLLAKYSDDPALRRLTPVGWYHSHTRSGIVLTKEDIEIWQRHFPEPWQAAIVLRPRKSQPIEAGLFVRGADGSVQGDAPKYLIEPGRAHRGEALVELRARRRMRPMWRWLALAVFLAAVGAGLLLQWWRRPGVPLSLKVFDRDGNLYVQWDPSADAVRHATGGRLEISDGQTRSTVMLDAAQLNVGSAQTGRSSSDVTVRLKIDDGPKPAEEIVRLFDGSAVQEEDSGALSIALKQQEQAREQVTSLEGELRKQIADNDRLEQKLKDLGERARVAAAVRTAPAPAAAKPETPPSPSPAPVTQVNPAPPPVPALPKATAAYAGPRAGKLIWTGFLTANAVLTIEGRRPSSGQVTGQLPGVPVQIAVYPGELSSSGLTVFSANPRHTRGETEPPGPQNSWNQTTFRYDPNRARDLVVSETSSTRVTVRAVRPVSVIVVEWEVLP